MKKTSGLLRHGDLVKSKWETPDGFVPNGVILGWATESGRSVAQVLWTDQSGTRVITVLRHHLERA